MQKFEVVGVKNGIVKKEDSANKGKSYQFLTILFDSNGWDGKASKEIFIFDEQNGSGRPFVVGDIIDIDFTFGGRIKQITLA